MSLTSLKPHLKYEASYNPLLFTIKPLLDPASTTNPNTQIPACPVILLYPTHTHTCTHKHHGCYTCVQQTYKHGHTHIQYSSTYPFIKRQQLLWASLQKQKPAKCCQTLTANSSSVHRPNLQHVCTARVLQATDAGLPLCYSS